MKNIESLRDALSTPSAALITDITRLDGDIMVLGAAGKLGPSLVELAVRAVDAAGTSATVYAVSRFSDPDSRAELDAIGARTIAADISDEAALAALPDAQNVIFLVGAKFGTDGNESATWATNAYLPGRVADRFRNARIVALSTGNVYPLVSFVSGGASETDPVGPVGEYAMSCLGRERVLTHFSRTHGTPLTLIRLNYAVEARYGVIVDLAQQILAGTPLDLATGAVNVVWQGYANEVILRALLHASDPHFTLNLTGPEILSITRLGTKIAAALGESATFTGEPEGTALLADATLCHTLFGYPEFTPDRLITEVAEWLRAGGEVLGKPTKFQNRDGRF